MSNCKAAGPDCLPVKLLGHPEFTRCFHSALVKVWNTGDVSQQGKATIKVLPTEEGRFNFICREVPLAAHTCRQGFVEIVASRLSNYCEQGGILPEEQCGFRPARSTADILCAVRRLQELGRERVIPSHMCFIDLQKAYGSVGREQLWEGLGRFGALVKMLLQLSARSMTYGRRGALRDRRHAGASTGLRALAFPAQHVLRRCITRCPRSLQRGRRHRAQLIPS